MAADEREPERPLTVPATWDIAQILFRHAAGCIRCWQQRMRRLCRPARPGRPMRPGDPGE